jgi:16S rRNA (cytosine967-C5)-methyltransferase
MTEALEALRALGVENSSFVSEPGQSNPAGAIQDIAYRTMRGRGRADALLANLAHRKPESPLLRELLVVAIALLDAGAGGSSDAIDARSQAPYTPFTIVDQAVEAAASLPELKNAKGFVNAVLRKLQRDRARLVAAVTENVEARWNYPAWWVEKLHALYPQQWENLLETGNTPPRLVLRVNRRKSGVSDYLERLKDAGLGARQIGASAVRLDTPLPVTRIPGFSEGLVSVQDEAAQRAAPLADVHDGMRVLDACAAPGGKTCHLLELADLDLTALDVSAGRLALVQQNLDRLKLTAKLQAGSASRPQDWWDGEPFDRIVADVPCTASGIVRRHPDIRWLRRESDIASLSRIQQQILDALWRLLRPDGKLLLVTCSLFSEESINQSAAFAKRHRDARALCAPGQLLPTVSEDGAEHDGLFFALFQKAA